MRLRRIRESVVTTLKAHARQLHVDRLVTTAIGFDDGHDHRFEGFGAAAHGQPDFVTAARESRQVLVEAERLAVIDGQYFVNPVAKQVAAVQWRDMHVCERLELPLVPCVFECLRHAATSVEPEPHFVGHALPEATALNRAEQLYGRA